ncbi:DUF4232 domain-containing protein [Streptomyces sp. NPDC001691]|uniref:DUF4232 domain-containing protein n=1 Tax=Streptomyces sp. NPDC001691 TaxID=3364600 RepID=UPI0036A56DC0
MGRGRGRVAVVGLAVLLAALTACTDRVPSGADGTGVKTAAHGSAAPPSGAPRERPAPPLPAPGDAGPSPSPGAESPDPSDPSALPGSPTATPPPGTPGPDTRTGPPGDGGEDARGFCSATSLSLSFRVADDVRGSRPGADAKAAGDAILVVRNTSGHTCVLHGTPAVVLLDAGGRAAPLAAAPAKPFAKPFALHPGANGVARMYFAPGRDCPARGTSVRVTLPGSDSPSTLPVLDTKGRPATLPLCGPAPRTGPFRPGFG